MIKTEKIKLSEAVRHALLQVTGAYAIVVLSKNNPSQLIAARKSSPLVIGIGKDEFFLASDASPIIEYTPPSLEEQNNDRENELELFKTVDRITKQYEDNIN